MNIRDQAQLNMTERFVDNPCRGIVVGMDEDNNKILLSWIMGRSNNSRNRLYVVENDVVRTVAADESKVEDPRLIIYKAMLSETPRIPNNKAHIVSNGDQTDTVAADFRNGLIDQPTFVKAMSKCCCEPDFPNFTPRITGYVADNDGHAYLSILKADPAARELWNSTVESLGISVKQFEDEGMSPYVARMEFENRMLTATGFILNKFKTQRQTFSFPLNPGLGYCLTTYKPGSEVLQSFEGEPFSVPIAGSLEDNMARFWSVLEEEHRVSLAGKRIAPKGEVYVADPINKYDQVVKDGS